MKKCTSAIAPALLLLAVMALFHPASAAPPLKGKKICIDPGHGGTAATDNYRVGKHGEREEWINLRVALLLKKMLEKQGAIVTMTRTTDDTIGLEARAGMAVKGKADVFLSIHHNATADSTVNFPIIYFHGAASENVAGVKFGKALAGTFQKYFFQRKTPVTVVSDYTIFPMKGASVLRNSYGIPGLLAEASFFSNQDEEDRLKQAEHNQKEATAYFHALEIFFLQPAPPVREKKIPLRLPVFPVLQEAERMQPDALLWLNDYQQAMKLTGNDTALLHTAYHLFTRSARSFPDSYVARQCHEHRSEILRRWHLDKEAEEEKTRAREFYPQ